MPDELIWYCRQCGKAMKVQPGRIIVNRCSCKTPIVPLTPTRVILGRSRTYQAAQARHLAMHAIRHHAGLSYARLAAIFGVLATTAFCAVREVNHRQRQDPILRGHLNAIRAELAS